MGIDSGSSELHHEATISPGMSSEPVDTRYGEFRLGALYQFATRPLKTILAAHYGKSWA